MLQQMLATLPGKVGGRTMPCTGPVLPSGGYHGYHVLRPATAPGFAYKVYYYCTFPPLLPNLTRPRSASSSSDCVRFSFH